MKKSKYTIPMGWGHHQNLRQVHFWMSNAHTAMVETKCQFAKALYFHIRDAEPDEVKCPDCAKDVEAK